QTAAWSRSLPRPLAPVGAPSTGRGSVALVGDCSSLERDPELWEPSAHGITAGVRSGPRNGCVMPDSALVGRGPGGGALGPVGGRPQRRSAAQGAGPEAVHGAVHRGLQVRPAGRPGGQLG